MAFINRLPGGSSEGTALPEHVIEGKTFSNDDDTGLVGTVKVNPSAIANTNHIDCDGEMATGKHTPDQINRVYIRPQHLATNPAHFSKDMWFTTPYTKIATGIGLNANQIAKGQTVLDTAGTYTSDATASAWDIYTGRTAYVNGQKLTGTMADITANPYAGVNGADSTSFNDTTMATGTAANESVGAFDLNFKKGYNQGTSASRVHIPNLLPQNIMSGVKVGWVNAHIVGTASTPLVNFPLSIQDAQPTAVRNGHIWIKSSTLNSQITAIYIQEAVTATGNNGVLQFVVGETSNNHYLWMHNGAHSVTSGGSKSTQVTMNNQTNVDWTVSFHSGNMEYKLPRPRIYSKIGGVLDIETAYMWNGSSWIMLSQKGHYVYTANTTDIVFYNRAGDTITHSQTITQQSSSYVHSNYTASNDGTYVINGRYVLKRTGDTYAVLQDLTYSAQSTGSVGFTPYIYMMTPDGKRIVGCGYQYSSSYEYWRAFSYVFNGTQFVLEGACGDVSGYRRADSDDYAGNSRYVTNYDGSFIGMFWFDNQNSSRKFSYWFRNGSSVTSNGEIISGFDFSTGNTDKLFTTPDGTKLIAPFLTGSTSYSIAVYNIDYVNKKITEQGKYQINTTNTSSYRLGCVLPDGVVLFNGPGSGYYTFNPYNGVFQTLTGTGNINMENAWCNLAGDRIISTLSNTARIVALNRSALTYNEVTTITHPSSASLNAAGIFPR